jgi:imidazolonepropionase-like amidohydrolase
VLFVALFSTARLAAQSATSFTLIKAARLLDPRSGNVLAPAAVLIEGDKIKQIGISSQVAVPAGFRV